MYKRIIPVLFALVLSFSMNAQVAFDIGEVSGDQGTQVCVPVTVTDFNNIASFGLSILYNPLELSYVDINWPHTAVPPGINPNNPGIINFAWFDLITTFSLNDGDVLMEVCFDILAAPGTISPLAFSDGSIPNTVVPDVSDGNFMALVIAGLDPGSVTVTGSAGGLTVTYGKCSTLDIPVSNGSIQILVGGGAPPYTATYSEIANPANNGSFIFTGTFGTTPTNLPSGDYTIIVMDSAGGTESTIQTIQQLPPLLLPLDRTDPMCAGGNDGTMTLNNNNPLGGVGPHSIVWSTSDVNTQMITGLVQGSYIVTVVDSDGCVMVGSQAIIDPLAVVVDSINQTNLTCLGNGMDGSLTVSGSGGTIAAGSSYSYSWIGPNGFSSALPSISNLPIGQYCVDVSDDNSCVTTRCFTLTNMDGPNISSFTTVGIACQGDMNGAITANFTTGSNTIDNILWSNNESTQTISSLGAGTYVVTITDAVGCSAIDSTTIAAPNPLTIDSIGFESPSCPEFDLGRLAAIVSGGSGNYTYSWDNGQTAALSFGLTCGQNYSVTISDGSSCPSVDTTVFLPCPPAIVANFDFINDVSCNMGIPCDGSATVIASGGTTGSGLYDFSWNNGQFTTTSMGQSTATNLCEGWNYVVINDLACQIRDSVFIDGPPAITVDIVNIDNISCDQGSDGSITVAGAGGAGNFTYQWDGGPAADTNSGLSQGTYTIVVTDGNMCESAPFNIDLPDPDPIDLQVSAGYTNDPSCNSDTDGTIDLFFTGGNNDGVATYNWVPNVSTSSFASNLAAGVYAITVTDSRGCTGETTHTLMSPPPIDFTLGPILEPACFGEQATVSIIDAMGGSGSMYSYSVGSSIRRPISQPLFVSAADSLSVKVYDENGCFDEQFINISEPDMLILEFGTEEETIDLGESFILNPFINTEFPIDSIIWDPITDLACLDSSNLSVSCESVEVNPFNDTRYEITIIDINGCRTSASFDILVDKNRGIFFPNVFSPNNDGVNDIFTMFTGPGIEEISSTQVYSRWGAQIVSLDAFQPTLGDIPIWDGFFNGKIMNPGVFIYVVTVRFLDGIEVTYRGDITILR